MSVLLLWKVSSPAASAYTFLKYSTAAGVSSQIQQQAGKHGAQQPIKWNAYRKDQTSCSKSQCLVRVMAA